MAKYRAQIVWDFEFDEDGYTESEREYLEEWEDEPLTPRTQDEMIDYARSELIEALWDNVKYNDLDRMVEVVAID